MTQRDDARAVRDDARMARDDARATRDDARDDAAATAVSYTRAWRRRRRRAGAAYRRRRARTCDMGATIVSFFSVPC